MPIIFVILTASILVSCGTYKDNQMWRRSTCEPILDTDERARCLEEATKPESEYKREVEEALGS